MDNPNLISARTDRATGVYLEHWKRAFPTLGAGPTFWFAYPFKGAHAFDGAAGDSAAEAVRKLLAKRAPVRRAA